MDKALFRQLNQIYGSLHHRALRLTQALAQRGIEAEWGWYDNHSVRVDGEYRTEEFPIPVVDVGDRVLLTAVEDCRRRRDSDKA